MKMYTVRDATVERFWARIFLFENDAHAIRVFKTMVTNADDSMSDNPDDYILYYLGTYSDEDGIPLGQDPQRVITGIEAVKQRNVDLKALADLNAEIARIKANGAAHHQDLTEFKPGGTD